MRKLISVFGYVVLFHATLARTVLAADDLGVAATAVNRLGIDLLSRVAKADENVVISPYSIQSALAMTYAGAAGETKAEMARVLHFPDDEAALHGSFAALAREMEAMHRRTAGQVRDSGPIEPVTLEIANRLYGQSGYAFRPEFLSRVKDGYGAPFQPVDFLRESERVRLEINGWVAERTRGRILDLVPVNGVNERMRLALVNAIYFKAPWANEFMPRLTEAAPFCVGGSTLAEVPTMRRQGNLGYRRGEGFCAVTLGYVGGDAQLLVLLPDAKDGLAALEAKLSPQLLSQYANLAHSKLILHLPKFKLEPPVVSLGFALQSLGLRTAFDQPGGSANFDRMAPRKPDDHLYLSKVFHKAFIAVDEKGTEAAAATAVAMAALAGQGNPSKPIEVKVDHPFIFAIQHRPSGACLFLGRVVDPR